jgi:uncharacterized protein with HEPN domain
MRQDKIGTLIEIAKIHESRLLYALSTVEDIFPLTEEKVTQLNEQQVVLIDSFVHRFTKLQDFMGATLIDAVLIHLGEFSNRLTMIDKMNKLEKFYLIEDAHTWQEMRELRNHLTHEYPGHPELVAKFLNQAYPMSFELLKILNNLLEKVE